MQGTESIGGAALRANVESLVQSQASDGRQAQPPAQQGSEQTASTAGANRSSGQAEAASAQTIVAQQQALHASQQVPVNAIKPGGQGSNPSGQLFNLVA